MKGILIEPGKEPVVTTLPDSLWAIENRLGTRSEMIVLPRTPAVLFVGRYDGPIQPASLLNRTYRGRQLYGPILCYGWKGNNIQPMSRMCRPRCWTASRTRRCGYDYLYLQMRTASEEIHRYQYHWQPSVWLCTRP